MRSRVLLALIAFVGLTACGTSGGNTDAGSMPRGVGESCGSTSDCRQGLDCAPATRTCEPRQTAALDQDCTLTAECLAGLYCAQTSERPRCRPAGDVGVNGTCGDTGSCIRGLVCVRNAPGLYGVCQAPRGIAVPGTDAGTGGARARDLYGPCMDTLDCLAGLACSAMNTCRRAGVGDGIPRPWPGETCDDNAGRDGGSTEVRSYFEVPAADGTPPHDFFRLPFPNDIRRDAATGRINLRGFPHPPTSAAGFDIVGRYAEASSRAGDIDGFGTNQIVYFRFSGNIDFGSLQLNNTVQLVDLTANAGTGSIHFGANTGRNRYLCDNYLTVDTGVGVPMQPGHTYAAILTTGIRGPMNIPVARDADFGPMLAATPPADSRLTAAYAAYAPFRAYLAAHVPPINPDTILNAAVFTTQHPTTLVSRLREATRAQAAATATGFVRCDTGVRSPCDDGLTGAEHVRGCIGAADPGFDELQGQIDVPVFQRGVRPYATPGDGAIVLDAMGRPTVQSTERVCVTVTIPRGATMPASGWPVVLYGHGTGGNYRSVVSEGLAASISDIDLGSGMRARIATVGFEGVMHGARRGPGVTESPNTLFFNFANPDAARDNVLQGAADDFALVRALETIRLPMLPAATDTTAFDPARIILLGHSQGATVGVLAAAYEPNLAAIVMSGAGGDLRVSLTTKQHPVDIASLVPFILQDPEANAGGHPVLNLFQAFFERSDAVNYGPLLLYNRPMGVGLRPMVQTYGIHDTFSTDHTMRALSGSIGLPVAEPIPTPRVGGRWPEGMGIPLPVMNNINAPGGTTTAVLLEADPMDAYDGHYVLFRDAALRQRVMNFIGSSALGASVVR